MSIKPIAPEFSSCVWVPDGLVTEGTLAEFTIHSSKIDGTPFSVEAFRRDRPGYIGLPRQAAKKLFPEARCSMSEGAKAVFGKPIALRDYQEPIVSGIVKSAEELGDFVVKAATGKGKTVMALEALRRLGRTAAIVVDQENLLDQWVQRCEEHLGLPKESIGIVRGKVARYEDVPITICMVQTLAKRVYEKSFAQAFGVVVFDECQVSGAPTFSRALTLFDAKVRFGLSATPERRDALNKVIRWSLGDVAVSLGDKPHKALVYVLEHDAAYSWRSNNSKMAGQFLNEVAQDYRRNLRIATAIKWLYETGREVLVISDRVTQLSALKALTGALGVPEEDMGVYAKAKAEFRYEKDPRPKGRPKNWDKKSLYTPVKLTLAQVSLKKAERDLVARSSRVVFATYGVMAKGADIPRLSAGIDATPRSEGTQVYGRILRTQEGKPVPIWVTLEDGFSFRSLHQLSRRMVDYTNSNAEVYLWRPGVGRKKLEAKKYIRELQGRVAELRQRKAYAS